MELSIKRKGKILRLIKLKNDLGKIFDYDTKKIKKNDTTLSDHTIELLVCTFSLFFFLLKLSGAL